MIFKSVQSYSYDDIDGVREIVDLFEFKECKPNSESSSGFIDLSDDYPGLIGEFMVLKHAFDKKRLPKSKLKDMLAEFARSNDIKVNQISNADKSNIRDEFYSEYLPKVIAERKETNIFIDLKSKIMHLDTCSVGHADNIVKPFSITSTCNIRPIKYFNGDFLMQLVNGDLPNDDFKLLDLVKFDSLSGSSVTMRDSDGVSDQLSSFCEVDGIRQVNAASASLNGILRARFSIGNGCGNFGLISQIAFNDVVNDVDDEGDLIVMNNAIKNLMKSLPNID